jgi:hypothetical protein
MRKRSQFSIPRLHDGIQPPRAFDRPLFPGRSLDGNERGGYLDDFAEFVGGEELPPGNLRFQENSRVEIASLLNLSRLR